MEAARTRPRRLAPLAERRIRGILLLGPRLLLLLLQVVFLGGEAREGLATSTASVGHPAHYLSESLPYKFNLLSRLLVVSLHRQQNRFSQLPRQWDLTILLPYLLLCIPRRVIQPRLIRLHRAHRCPC